MKNEHVNHGNTQGRKDGKYGEVIRSIADDGVCPFCRENISRYHPNPLVEKKFWWVTDNAYPYKPTLFHKLFIHKEHIAHARELSPEAWAELLEIIREESGALGMKGGTFMLRFGDTRYTGASVSHLHANLVQSDPDDSSYDKAKGLLTRIG